MQNAHAIRRTRVKVCNSAPAQKQLGVRMSTKEKKLKNDNEHKKHSESGHTHTHIHTHVRTLASNAADMDLRSLRMFWILLRLLSRAMVSALSFVCDAFARSSSTSRPSALASPALRFASYRGGRRGHGVVSPSSYSRGGVRSIRKYLHTDRLLLAPACLVEEAPSDLARMVIPRAAAALCA